MKLSFIALFVVVAVTLAQAVELEQGVSQVRADEESPISNEEVAAVSNEEGSAASGEEAEESNEDASSGGSGDQPAVTTEQPQESNEEASSEGSGEEPAVTTEEPAVTTEEPAVPTEEPAVTTEQPAVTTEQPAVTTEQPEESSEEVEQELPLAEACNEELCQLPNCRCSSTNVPGGIPLRDTPQFVYITIENDVNLTTVNRITNLIRGFDNYNGCPVGGTVFLGHEFTDYAYVNEVYNLGYEIALNSISKSSPESYWTDASPDRLREEFADQKTLLSHFANIDPNLIRGVRIPLRQMSGNGSFQIMEDGDLLYDNSWETREFLDPGLWPYTLDYASTQDCVSPPCPSASLPGRWVLPNTPLRGNNDALCSRLNDCFAGLGSDAWFTFFVRNFDRHYLGNRSPFGIHISGDFLETSSSPFEGLQRFLSLITNLTEVFVVKSSEIIEWVQNPVPLDTYINAPCRSNPPAPCSRNTCSPLFIYGEWVIRSLSSCRSECPARYPWLGNPLGNL